MREGLEAELKHAAAIFSGTVLSTWVEKDSQGERLAAKIRVERVWKGVEAPAVVVETRLSHCTFRFRKGQRVLVFGHYMRGQRLRTSQCSPTAPIDSSAVVLARLGEGRRPKR